MVVYALAQRKNVIAQDYIESLIIMPAKKSWSIHHRRTHAPLNLNFRLALDLLLAHRRRHSNWSSSFVEDETCTAHDGKLN